VKAARGASKLVRRIRSFSAIFVCHIRDKIFPLSPEEPKIIRRGIAMLLATRIKFVFSENDNASIQNVSILNAPIPGVKVSLFDRDDQDEDDFLASGTTDAKGEILFSFYSEQYTDEEDQPLWQKESLPDLYIVAYDASGKQVFSTRAEAIEDKLIRVKTYPFTRAQALEYGWITA
jgi:hypothetical protein